MKKLTFLVYGLLFLLITTSLIPVLGNDDIDNVSFEKEVIPEKSGKVYVIVNSTIHDELISELNQYKKDVQKRGWKVSIVENTFSNASPLRQFLYVKYKNENLVGVFFVGNLPHATYEMSKGKAGYHNFPIDLYYRDLDGEWKDTDGNGIFDKHEKGKGDLKPEIWLGRICMKTFWKDETELYKNYFDKIHNYRTNNISVSNEALVYLDDDWTNDKIYAKDSVDDLYSDLTVVTDKNTTVADDYKERIKEGYDWIHIHSHSANSSTKHVFQYNDGVLGSGGDFTSRDLFENGQKSLFANIYTSNAANYTTPDYLSGWYALTEDYGLANIGTTTNSGMFYYKNFYDSLSEGDSLGEAFQDWWDQHGESDRSMTYGMTIIGDPTLIPLSSQGRDRIPHDPIRIDSDEEFKQTAFEEGWNGTGSKNSPYIIKNYEINSTGFSNGIYISNTTYHFKIKNCYVHDAKNPGKQKGSGITLKNTVNGVIRNNTIKENYKDGLKIFSSSSIKVDQTTITNNQGSGIYVINSNNISITSNSYHKNNQEGVLLDNSNNINISSNKISRNIAGIYINRSEKNDIQNNIIKNNSVDGVLIEDSNSIKLKVNEISKNKKSGLLIKNSTDNLIQNNSINLNDMGLKLFKSEENRLMKNEINNNNRGIILELSKHTKMKENNLEKNHLEILYGPKDTWNTHSIDESNTIDGEPILYIKNKNSIVLEKDYSQIILANCTDIELVNEEISNMYRIDLGYCDKITIKNSTVKNLDKSIRLISTTNTDIIGNSILKNERGIVLFNSNENTIFNNDIKMNDKEGIHILSSYNNIIANNTLEENKDDGIEISSSLANLIKNNLFLSNNKYAIRSNDQSRLNVIYRNSFLWNNGAGQTYNTKHIQAYGNGESYWNSSSEVGNYWRDWTSPDSNSDSIVDSPYIIDGDNNARDYYPLTKSPVPLIPRVQDFEFKFDSGKVKLSWKDSSESGYLNIDQYWIYREDSSVTAYFIGNVSADTFSFTDNSLKEKGTYTYYIRAVNLTEDEAEGSPASKKISIEYVPEENDDFPIYLISILIGVIGIAVVGVLIYRKIGKESK